MNKMPGDGGDAELQEKIVNWIKWDKNEKTRQEIDQLVVKNDVEALRSRMFGQLTFGTAGIRARMEAGFNRLNDLTVIQISHGMARHIKAQFPGESRGVALGYDGRHNSLRFAQLASNVFIRNGIKVYLFSKVVPTPLVSYATIVLKCDAGLMITASHNPKEDNGYKAYWSNGAQILAPHDAEIVRIAKVEPEPRPEYWDLNGLETSSLMNSADSTIDRYFEEERQLARQRAENAKCPIKFTYSAFHGVGLHYAQRIFKEFGFPEDHIVIVKEQAEPDPDFPTVPFPNPEEGRSVLTLSMQTAEANGSTFILANDPDADRLQMAEMQSDGQWRIFTGNEMGTLLAWYVWKNWREANPKADTSKIYFLNSAVSSQIVKTMAEMEGFKNDVTLTGFKWMGNLAEQLRNDGYNVLLSWEESIGFMPGRTYDKDGISSAGMFAEIAAYLHAKGQNMSDQLFDIYNNSYFFVPKPEITKNIFAKLRKNLQYPTKIGSEKVKWVRDLTTGYDNSYPDKKAVLPISTSSEMITFTLDNGSLATLRASGTEPKIKYYIELRTEPGKQASDLGEVMVELNQLEMNVIETLLEPESNGLVARK